MDTNLDIFKQGYTFFATKLQQYLPEFRFDLILKFNIMVEYDINSDSMVKVYKLLDLYTVRGLCGDTVDCGSYINFTNFKESAPNIITQHYNELPKYKRGLNYKYLNNIFIGRFISRGCKERALRGYTWALNYLHINFNNTLTITNTVFNYNLIYLYSIVGSDVCLYNYIYKKFKQQPDLLQTNTLNTLNDYDFDWVNCSGIFKLISECAPPSGIVVNRVSSVIYKNTRGKSGRYIASLQQLNKNTGLRYMLRYYKLTWRFSHARTYNMKFVDVLYGIVINPKHSLGVIYGE